MSRHLLRVAATAACSLSAVCFPAASGAAESPESWFALRNQNPFLQIYGLPSFQGAELVGRGDWVFRAGLDVANHADAGETVDESIVIDGESYFLEVSARYGIGERTELAIEIPVVSHRGGALDGLIYDWHDLLGISNTKRERPDNALEMGYRNTPAGLDFGLPESSTGLGDIRLGGAYMLARRGTPTGLDLSVRATVKLPTGDAETLAGSGATDVALAVHASAAGWFGIENLRLAGMAGAIWLGDSDLFFSIQEDIVPFAGGSASIGLGPRWEFLGGVYAQGYFYDSALDELSGKSIQLGIGANYRLRSGKYIISLGFIEDVVGDTTPDFAFSVSICSAAGGTTAGTQ